MTTDPDAITHWLADTPRTAFRKRQVSLHEQDGQIIASCYPHGPGRPHEARGESVPAALQELARLIASEAETGLHRL